MKCWSRNDPLFAAIVLNSSTPHTFSVFKYFALALLCPRESWSPTSTASRSRRRCRRKPVLPRALCVHSTHSRIQSSPHDSVPPHASCCCRELHHPDTISALSHHSVALSQQGDRSPKLTSPTGMCWRRSSGTIGESGVGQNGSLVIEERQPQAVCRSASSAL